MPRCIGVVTSKTGAAWQDVQNVIGRRWPMVKLLLAPVNVQGIEAEKSITEGIRRLDRDPRPDLILITRGGGSKEDLPQTRSFRCWARDRHHHFGLCGRPARTDPLGGRRTLCAGPGRMAAENIHFTAKYSKKYTESL